VLPNVINGLNQNVEDMLLTMQDTTATTPTSPYGINIDLETADIFQLDSMTSANPTPEQCLLAAVIEQALCDVKIPAYQDEASAFIASDNFEVFCEMLGWNVERVRGLTKPLNY
jgi:hypothetical protein